MLNFFHNKFLLRGYLFHCDSVRLVTIFDGCLYVSFQTKVPTEGEQLTTPGEITATRSYSFTQCIFSKFSQ